jgi:hypothetical protein
VAGGGCRNWGGSGEIHDGSNNVHHRFLGFGRTLDKFGLTNGEVAIVRLAGAFVVQIWEANRSPRTT